MNPRNSGAWGRSLDGEAKSRHLIREARKRTPGGVSSPVRAHRAAGIDPLFVARAEGAWLTDVDGKHWLDYVLSYGPLLAGHAHPKIVTAIQEAAEKGTSYGACTEGEIRLIDRVQSLMPGIELLRLVNSGTEAVMSALRVARAYTGRNKVIKCAGNYHGHADGLLVQAGSGVATLGLPDSAGVPHGTVRDTLVVPYNSLDAVEGAFEQWTGDIAAMIVEPVAGNMGVVLPVAGYLEGLRRITHEHGALLIFDEVMTGFRVHPGGAQALYGIDPDLTTLGKVIGGGLPIGAYGGREDIMRMVAPDGPVYQAGTLSGNPIAVAAGLATLEVAFASDMWEQIDRRAASLEKGLDAAFRDVMPVQIHRVGTMLSCFYTDQPVRDWETASSSRERTFCQTLPRDGRTQCVFATLAFRGVVLVQFSRG